MPVLQNPENFTGQQMLNFFYYFYYRIREANNKSGNDLNQANRAAYFTLVILLMLNALSLYFISLRLFHNDLVDTLWKDKFSNRVITIALGIMVAGGVYAWYRLRHLQIDQALTHFKSESSDERRVGGVMILAYIFSSCGLLIYAMFLPFL